MPSSHADCLLSKPETTKLRTSRSRWCQQCEASLQPASSARCTRVSATPRIPALTQHGAVRCREWTRRNRPRSRLDGSYDDESEPFVTKTMGGPVWATWCCKSSPLMSGRSTSRIRQDGTSSLLAVRYSAADPNETVLKPSDESSSCKHFSHVKIAVHDEHG